MANVREICMAKNKRDLYDKIREIYMANVREICMAIILR